MEPKIYKAKRVYEDYSPQDGYRVLVDRLWPRGVSKEVAHLDAWYKEIAPSTELRKWFDHDSEKFEEFRDRYKKELRENWEAINKLLKEADKKTVTLLYAARDKKHNHARVLKEFLEAQEIK